MKSVLGIVLFLACSSAHGQDNPPSNNSGSLLSRKWNVREVRCVLQGKSISFNGVTEHNLTIDAWSQKAVEILKFNDGKNPVETRTEYSLKLTNVYMTNKSKDFSHSSKIEFQGISAYLSHSTDFVPDPVDLFDATNFSFVQAQGAGEKDKLLIFKQETASLYQPGPRRCPVGDVKVMVLEDGSQQ